MLDDKAIKSFIEIYKKEYGEELSWEEGYELAHRFYNMMDAIYKPIPGFGDTGDFEHPEDRQYFIDLLADGDEVLFEKRYRHYFDFRDSEIKREEFSANRKDYMRALSQVKKECGLKLSSGCTKGKDLEIDHLIPLATNKLNKQIRSMSAQPGKKVPAQSYGSNNWGNLVLACHNCNAEKKHRLLDKQTLRRIINNK